MNGSGMLFPERDYWRRCAMCGFLADPGYPWEENLRPLEFCPSCGIPLERLACSSCGAPVVVTRGGGFFGMGQTINPCCGYCGDEVTRRESRHRTKPPSNEQPSPTIIGRDDIAARYLRPFSEGLFRIVFDYEGQRLQPTATLFRRACAYKKAEATCRCAPCKSIRRHLKKRKPG